MGAEVSADIEGRLPPAYDIELALIQFPVRYDEAMNTVLTQELQRFNNLTDLIKGMLKEVQRAIKGLVVMSGELETMGNSMVTGKVPGAWAKAAYPSRLQVPHTCTRYRSTGKAPERASSAPRAIRRTSSCSFGYRWPRSTRSSTGSSAAWRCCRSWTTRNCKKI